MTGGKNILVVDDEQMIREALTSYLEKQGCHVFQAETGREALQVFQRESISFVILDLMLPDFSGEEVCIRIRKESRVPVIMLTAKTMETDMLNGLDIGADDYITKPFSLKNLYARMQAVWRRTLESPVPVVSRVSWNYGDLVIDQDRKEVCKQVFTREDLIELVFGLDFSGYDRVIDTHVKNLRKKLEDDPKQPVYICTVHGMGYKFGGFRE